MLTGLLAVPLAAAAPFVPAARTLAALLLGGLALAALVDAVLAGRLLAGVEAELPRPGRLSKDAEDTVEIRLRSTLRPIARLRVNLALPAVFDVGEEGVETTLPEADKTFLVRWPCTPRRRGQYPVSACYLEAPSPFGLWHRRRRCPAEGELRVYPNLRAERRRVAALFLTRDNPGIHRHPRVGKGREFEKLRDYLPEDSYQDVHWKATAKRGHPVTKIFQTERTQEVYVIVDASRLSARPLSADDTGFDTPLGDATVLERFVVSALMMGVAAEQQGDTFGLLTFSDRIQSFLKAGRGKAHYATCRDALYTLQPETVTPDFEELVGFIRTRIRKRALLIFFTHLDDPVLSEQFLRSVELICRTHLVMALMPTPPGCRPLFDEPVKQAEEIYEHLGGHVLWHRLKETERELRHRGVKFDLIDQASLSARAVSRYVEVKRKQLL